MSTNNNFLKGLPSHFSFLPTLFIPLLARIAAWWWLRCQRCTVRLCWYFADTYAYLRIIGADGLIKAAVTAILSANYIAKSLGGVYPILYIGHEVRVAHECIIDIRQTQDAHGISNEYIAKRLINYGFHAPTMSFPVAGTLMIKPTETELRAAIDRFCKAMMPLPVKSTQLQKVFGQKMTIRWLMPRILLMI